MFRFVVHYIIVFLLWLPPYLIFKSEESVSQINDSKFLNFEPLKYSPSDNTEEILLDEECDPDSKFDNGNAPKFDTPYLSGYLFRRGT